ncbi:unnamed protein product, partial [Cochlearia groenlandica]
MGKGKLILICQSGGKFVTDDDGRMTYTGGEAEAMDITRETSFDEFKLKMAKVLNLDYNSLSLKYFLPGNRRTLITIKQAKDMKRMYDFHHSSVTADVFITGQEGFRSQAFVTPIGKRSNNLPIETEATLLGYGNVANVPIQVVTETLEESNIVDVSLRSRKVAPRIDSESGDLIDIPVTVSTNAAALTAKSTSKKFKTNGKKSLVCNISKQSSPKISPTTSTSVVCGMTTDSPKSVSKRKRVMEEPIILLQDENVADTRRRSLRNRGEIRKTVIETDDEDYIYSDENEDVDVDDEKDFEHNIDPYFPEAGDLDSNRKIDCSISGVKDGSVESLVASWKRCITGVGQGFESVVEFRDALQKYAVACRFGYRL